jgi:hypothetical protein
MSVSRILVICWAGFGLVIDNSAVEAGSAFAEIGDAFRTVIPLGPAATVELRGFAEDPPARANATTTDSGPPPGTATTFSGEIGGWFGNGYSPIVGVDAGKSASRTITSSSGTARALAESQPPAVIPGGLLTASVIDRKGGAAAQAVDPYNVPPGTYPYAPIITQFGIDTSDGVGAGASYFATDSRFSDFLWRLAIGSTGFIDDPTELFVAFSSNPILGLSDDVVAARVRSAVAISAGTASLVSFLLFDTFYTVDRPIEYGIAAEADLPAVPEPSSLALLGFAVASLVGWSWGWRS